MEDKERYLSILGSIQREGIPEFMEWIQGTDFFEAPASANHHGAAPGMLCKHSLNTHDMAFVIHDSLVTAGVIQPISKESIALATLTHDVCKADFYTKTISNRKNEETGKWEPYMRYTIKEKFCFGGHGSKSMYLVDHFVKLIPEEAVAINCHMSSWDGNEYVGNAFQQFPLAWIVHVADEAATFLLESKK